MRRNDFPALPANKHLLRWELKISASGVESPGAMEVYLDGKPLKWETNGILDRSFYEVRRYITSYRPK
jgi:hypothetical protein